MEDAGKMIGVVYLKNIGKRWAYLSVEYVLPAYRGKGIGKKLFMHAVAEARKEGRGIASSSRNQTTIDWMKEAGMELHRGFLSSPAPLLRYYCTSYISGYRIAEALRKARIFKHQPPWMYGRLEPKFPA